ncbi:hypothetical protein ACH427_16100 [Streptomyces sp. NPDC020379]
MDARLNLATVTVPNPRALANAGDLQSPAPGLRPLQQIHHDEADQD